MISATARWMFRAGRKKPAPGSRSLWSSLDDDIITTERTRQSPPIRCHERADPASLRWVMRIRTPDL
ncbi:hypothetical protein [Escherichia coli]|uniref:hypothetical protein n=1 Tax=Escherichia coli TaxID=562 RepID=UPI0039B6FCBB